MTSDKRNENIDSFRGLLVLTVFLGHANLFLNAYRPYFRNEGGLFLIPWEHYCDGIIRLFLHPVAAAFIGLAGFTLDRFLASKPDSFLVARGLILIFLDLTVVSFAFIIGGFTVNPTFGALSVTGFGLLISPLIRKLSLGEIIGAMVVLKLTSMLLPFSFAVRYPLLQALFHFYSGGYFSVLYAPLGWLLIFLAGVAISRLQKTPPPFFNAVNPGIKRDSLLVILALVLSAVLQKVFLLRNPQLQSFLQMEQYPAGNAFMMFSLAWIVGVFNLARIISISSKARKFLGHLARHGLVYYLSHLYVFSLITWCLHSKRTGTFATAVLYFAVFAGCIFLSAAVRPETRGPERKNP